MSRTGQRLGYGRGFYDRFLANRNTATIALAYSKSILKNIPSSDGDIRIQWVVTEDEVIGTS
jgi:5-formyltetrahydrofolate cyclo-ligase